MKPKRKKIPYLWVSFANEDHGSAGVVIIRARNVLDAARAIQALDIAPKDFHGQVAAFRAPDDVDIPEEATNRLLQLADVKRLLPHVPVMNSKGEPR
jgi:hypothetical protein